MNINSLKTINYDEKISSHLRAKTRFNFHKSVNEFLNLNIDSYLSIKSNKKVCIEIISIYH